MDANEIDPRYSRWLENAFLRPRSSSRSIEKAGSAGGRRVNPRQKKRADVNRRAGEMGVSLENKDGVKPPHSVEAEKGVLGSVLQAPAEVMPLCVTTINDAKYFYLPSHQTIWTGASDLWDSERPIDLITITQELRDRGQLENVGGASYLTELLNFVPTAANVSYYLETVEDQFKLRRVAAITTQSARRAGENGASAAAILNETHHSLAALEVSNGLPRIEDAAAIVNSEIELPPDVIEGLLHRGSKMVLGGGSKSFKTWQLADLAIAIATGSSWLSHPTRKGRVLYINLELAERFFSRRLQVICQARSVTIAPTNLSVWNLRGHSASLPHLTDALLRQRGVEPYSLIAIDPIYKVLGARDENKAGDIAALLNEIERLAVRTGAAVVFGAHFSKGNQAGKESIDRIGGSGVFARDPDSILIFTQHEKPRAFTVEATLRNHPPIDPFVVRWDFPLMRIADELDPEDLRQKPGRKKQFSAEQLVEALRPVPPTTTEWKERSGMSDGTFNRLRRCLIEAGRVHKPKNRWLLR